MKRLLLLALLGVFLFAALTLARADRTIVVKKLLDADFTVFKIIVDRVGVMQMCGTYQVKDSTRAKVGTQKFYCSSLTDAQKTTLLTFIRDDVGLVAGANTQEGL